MKKGKGKRARNRQQHEQQSVLRFKVRLLELGVEKDKVDEIAEAARRMVRTAGVTIERAMEVVTDAIRNARAEGRLAAYDEARGKG